MSDLKGQEIRNAYDELLTKGTGNTVEDGDGVPFDIFNRAFTAGGLVRLPSGLNFNASGGDTLSDYEEGTFTPNISTSGTNYPSITYLFQSGVYIRIGKFVMVNIVLQVDTVDKTGATGVIFINLPFGAVNIVDSVTAGHCSGSGAWTPAPTEVILSNNSSNLLLRKSDATNNHKTNSSTSDIDNNAVVNASITYRTS